MGIGLRSVSYARHVRLRASLVELRPTRRFKSYLSPEVSLPNEALV